MKLHSLGISSKGNCHILTDSSGSSLILDCGIDYKVLLRNIEDWNNVACVLYTHSHRDHIRCLPELAKAGMRLYGYDNMKTGHAYKISPTWKIMAIPMIHNVDCIGFIIYNTVDDKYIVYATDTQMLPKIHAREYDLLLVECNWTERLVQDNAEHSVFSDSNYGEHLSTEVLSSWLEHMDKVHDTIILTHMSPNNIDYLYTAELVKPYCTHFMFAEKGKVICF